MGFFSKFLPLWVVARFIAGYTESGIPVLDSTVPSRVTIHQELVGLGMAALLSWIGGMAIDGMLSVGVDWWSGRLFSRDKKAVTTIITPGGGKLELGKFSNLTITQNPASFSVNTAEVPNDTPLVAFDGVGDAEGTSRPFNPQSQPKAGE